MTYDLRRLRLHGLIERLPGTHRYQLTDQKVCSAMFYARVYQRILRPGLALLSPEATGEPATLQRRFTAIAKRRQFSVPLFIFLFRIEPWVVHHLSLQDIGHVADGSSHVSAGCGLDVSCIERHQFPVKSLILALDGDLHTRLSERNAVPSESGPSRHH